MVRLHKNLVVRSTNDVISLYVSKKVDTEIVVDEVGMEKAQDELDRENAPLNYDPNYDPLLGRIVNTGGTGVELGEPKYIKPLRPWVNTRDFTKNIKHITYAVKVLFENGERNTITVVDTSAKANLIIDDIVRVINDYKR